MVSLTDPSAGARTRLAEHLRQRLEAAGDLAAGVREDLAAGNVAGIERSTSRLETIGQEFKVLAEEFTRFPPLEPEAEASYRASREWIALEATAARLARSSAVTGGLLERMVVISRGLLGLLSAANDGTYQSTGRDSDYPPLGLRLRERA